MGDADHMARNERMKTQHERAALFNSGSLLSAFHSKNDPRHGQEKHRRSWGAACICPRDRADPVGMDR